MAGGVLVKTGYCMLARDGKSVRYTTASMLGESWSMLVRRAVDRCQCGKRGPYGMRVYWSSNEVRSEFGQHSKTLELRTETEHNLAIVEIREEIKR